MTDILALAGRVLFGGLFVYNGLNHVTNYRGVCGYCAYKRVPMPSVAVAVSGAWLLAGGLSVVFGVYPRVGLTLIAVFLLGVTPKMHDFWTVTDPTARLGEQINFTKNAALLGAALMLLSLPLPWAYSLLS